MSVLDVGTRQMVPYRAASREGREDVIGRQLIAELFGAVPDRGFAVRYCTDAEEISPNSTPAFTLVFRRPGILRRIFFPPSELALAEAFARGDVEVEGDLEAAAALPRVLGARLRSPARIARVLRLGARLPAGERLSESSGTATRRRPRWLARHTRGRDAAAIRFHYDVGNDFYRLWLDRRMVYSCAYFPTDGEELDSAQEAKLDYICRKLRLAPGERLLDIGCGWGGLVRHAVRHYGVEALGITLSSPQAAYADERIRAEGLESRCRVEVRDYRDLPDTTVFDKVASVGMFEHVGRRRLSDYLEIAFRLTRPGGLFLNHGIVSLENARPQTRTDRLAQRLLRRNRFMDRYVFPDGELIPLGEVLGLAEAAGFEARDAESLREHYAHTLRHWGRRLEASHAAAVEQVGETTYRVWRLYLAASAHAFAVGRISVVQLLLAKPDAQGRCGLPPTRNHLYAAPPAGGPS
jgi:cyclopropane-fatty-acyl-phospholipid synthase